MNDPLCSINTFHNLPQRAVVVLYMMGSHKLSTASASLVPVGVKIGGCGAQCDAPCKAFGL